VSTRWVLVLGTIAAAVVLIASAGAGTQPAPSGTVYLNTETGVIKYLISHGIDPKGIVIQRGSHNYAGPSCPGPGWHCTTAKRVVQLTMAPNNPGGGGGGGGNTTNQFTCTASDDGSQTLPNECLIVQSSVGPAAADNNATCVEKINDPTGTQHCAIYQLNTSGGANNAYVQQQIAATAAPLSTQDATQNTEIAQWATTGSNNAQVNQDLKESQSGSFGKNDVITQTQNGHQTTAVSQHSDHGNNTAKVLQSLQLKESATGGKSVTQNQNTLDGGPNTSAAIYQNEDQAPPATITSDGTNNAYLFQASDLNASGSKIGDLTQQQGAQNNGGFGHIEQWSTGLSTGQANQNEHQSLGASQITGTLKQTQWGPFWFDPNQGSKSSDTLLVSQSSDQNAGAGAKQDDELWGACGSTGVCTVNQKVANDKQSTTNSCTSTPTSPCDIGVVLVSPPPTEGDNPYFCSGECTFPPFDTPPPPDICGQIESAPPCVTLLATTTDLVQSSPTTDNGCFVPSTSRKARPC
jgi:hypothetical protein